MRKRPRKKVSQVITTEGVEQGLVNIGSYKTVQSLKAFINKIIFKMIDLLVLNMTGVSIRSKSSGISSPCLRVD